MKFNNKGYTLVEVMTTITLLLIVIAPITIMFNMWYKNFHEDNAKVYLHQKARDIMGDLIQDLRRYSNAETRCDDIHTIYINDSFVYHYDEEEDKLLLNNNDVILNEEIKMVEFSAVEETGEDGVSSIIKIGFKLTSSNDTEVSLSTIFRKKIY